MDLSLVSALVTGYAAFRLGLRQDDRRWSRDRRAEVYVDMLTSVFARVDRDLEEQDGHLPPRMPREAALEAAATLQLEGRIQAFASAEVRGRYMALAALAGCDDGSDSEWANAVADALVALQREVRAELDVGPTALTSWPRRIRESLR